MAPLAGAARLESLFSGLEGLAGYVDAAGALPGADYHAPLMSLPHRRGEDRIPAGGPYLEADPKRIADWRARFSTLGGLKIGIAWQGIQTTKWIMPAHFRRPSWNP